MVQPCTLTLMWSDHINRSWEIIDKNFWECYVSRAPLNRRGWVVQERWLSSRVLHYGRHQILWECRELDACETNPEGLPRAVRGAGFKFDPELKSTKYPELEPRKYLPNPSQGSANRRRRGELISLYTAASLTEAEDKLVAISGIAQRMQRILDDEYLAGLWRKDLPHQLL